MVCTESKSIMLFAQQGARTKHFSRVRQALNSALIASLLRANGHVDD